MPRCEEVVSDCWVLIVQFTLVFYVLPYFAKSTRSRPSIIRLLAIIREDLVNVVSLRSSSQLDFQISVSQLDVEFVVLTHPSERQAIEQDLTLD